MLTTSEQIEQQIAFSPYLTGLQAKYPELSSDLSCELDSGFTKNPIAELKQICQELAELLDRGPKSNKQGDTKSLWVADIEQTLIRFKARFSFVWALAEFTSQGSFSERGELQTRFAEISIDVALKAAWYHVAQKQAAVAKCLDQYDGKMPGMFIFGMGKLGGKDLNFSSDVDLVAYFDPELIPIPDTLGKSYICHQALQKLTQILGQNGRADFIWRVDWRLRPNASATTLAMSTVAAQDYYYFRASPWHRLALMKARVVAGDRNCGQLFLNSITPFIWRQNLDYRALDELAEIKHKINLEHPSLKAQRKWREPINHDVAGFNVKLGSGGIREIEFIANALQLVWGGKRYALRTPNTLSALFALGDLGHLPDTVTEALTSAYKYLRRVENAIQIIGNQQTHLIPIEEIAQQKLQAILMENDWLKFVETLNQHRQLVSEHFVELFAEHESAELASLEWPVNLSAPAMEITDGWENGFYQYGVTAEMRQRLRPLALSLANYLSENSPPLSQANNNTQADTASATVLRVHDFFRSLPQGEQYFRLLAESPKLLESVIPPLLYSPPMSILLRQSPHIIDCYMGNMQLDLQQGFDSEFVVQADQYEIRLERLRRFVNEHLYQLYLMFLNGELSVEKLQAALSNLATHTLELAMQIVRHEMQLESAPITVVGMGKMGLGRMSPMSDLDLIFIFDPERYSLEVASKFVARLQTAISTPMREGVVYELDTRLRPSGRSGAPTVSIDSFANHQLTRAHTWEHIALVSSSVVAGDRSLEPRINDIKQQVIQGQRQAKQFLNDASKMWNRIVEHRVKEVSTELMFSKLRPGGLMQSEYFAACLILQNNSIQQTSKQLSPEQLSPEQISPEQLSTDCNFEYLLSKSVVGGNFKDLSKMIQFWRVQQIWERLLGWSELAVEQIPPAYLQRLFEHSEVSSLAGLEAKKIAYSKLIIQACDDFFAPNDELQDWQESSVQWSDSGS